MDVELDYKEMSGYWSDYIQQKTRELEFLLWRLCSLSISILRWLSQNIIYSLYLKHQFVTKVDKVIWKRVTLKSRSTHHFRECVTRIRLCVCGNDSVFNVYGLLTHPKLSLSRMCLQSGLVVSASSLILLLFTTFLVAGVAVLPMTGTALMEGTQEKAGDEPITGLTNVASFSSPVSQSHVMTERLHEGHLTQQSRERQHAGFGWFS